MVLESVDARLLFDYGMAPSDPPRYPEKCPPVDYALLSHAHLDHSGMMPVVVRDHAVPVLATPVTQPLSELLAHDSLKVARLEGYPPPYAKEDVSSLAGSWEDVEPGDARALGDVDVRVHDAGHVPGSVMFEVDDGSHRLLFTGDLNLIDSRLVAKAEPVRCDTLVVEATYSGRNHPDRRKVESDFVAAVAGVVERGGTVIVPAFAVGRTQEVLMVLAGHGFDVWVDGMGKEVGRHMLANPRSLRSARALSEAFQEASLVKTPHQRQRAADADVVVTTSGMLEGGPVVQYLQRLHRDPTSAVFITGFQVPGSNGRLLMDERRFPFDGRGPESVACEVRRFDFSAHAGHDEIVEFARACRAERVVLFHSDNRGPLADALREFADVVLPETGDVVTVSA